MKFDAWFDEQFGPDPEPGKELYEIRREVSAAHNNLRECEARYEAKKEWLARNNAALSAWVAREDYLKEEAECDSGK